MEYMQQLVDNKWAGFVVWCGVVWCGQYLIFGTIYSWRGAYRGDGTSEVSLLRRNKLNHMRQLLHAYCD